MKKIILSLITITTILTANNFTDRIETTQDILEKNKLKESDIKKNDGKETRKNNNKRAIYNEETKVYDMSQYYSDGKNKSNQEITYSEAMIERNIDKVFNWK